MRNKPPHTEQQKGIELYELSNETIKEYNKYLEKERKKKLLRRKEIMQNILSRLKSPVVLVQIIGTIVGVIIFFLPNQTEVIQVVTGAIVAIINLVSGLNNPSDKTAF